MRLKWVLLLVVALMFFWLLNVSYPSRQVEGCFSGCAGSSENFPHYLRVISLNMLHGFPQFDQISERLEIIAKEIVRLEADIVLLQEVPWTIKTGSCANYLAQKTGMNHAYQRANGNRWAILFEEGVLILSRYPLVMTESWELKPRERMFFQHRVVLKAVAHTPFGEIDIYNTHLSNQSSDINRLQSEMLAAIVGMNSDRIAIIAGDFNAEPDSAQIKGLPADWFDLLHGVLPESDGFTCCIIDLNQKTAALDKRIDYIFLKSTVRGFQPTSVKRVFDHPFMTSKGWYWASDHVGIMVDLDAQFLETK
jgi:endonuclease/exonuclease/phosphatase family metal-dependent hydrolase